MSNCRLPSATSDASGHPYGNLFGVRGAALRLIPSKYTKGLPGWLLKAAAAKKSFLLFGSLGLHNLSNGVEEAPHPRINVIAEAEINTTQIPNASEAKF